jgi:hypothetical protein
LPADASIAVFSAVVDRDDSDDSSASLNLFLTELFPRFIVIVNGRKYKFS